MRGLVELPDGSFAPPVNGARLRRRALELDALRGLAIVLMLVDHVGVFVPDLWPLRMTLGRVAMPLFFLLAGHLVGRLGVRHLLTLGLGFALPVAAPWVDSPNVLVWYVVGAVVLVAARAVRLPVWLLVVPALLMLANGFETPGVSGGYEPFALLAFMALGSMVPRASLVQLAAVLRVPTWLAGLGRHSLALYVLHVSVAAPVVYVLGGPW